MSSDLILFLAANPVGTSRLCLAEECAAIERELRAGGTHHFEFQSRWAVTIDELMHHLNTLQPTVIHFSGHGTGSRCTSTRSAAATRDVATTAESESDTGIYLQDDTGAPQVVAGAALTAMIESTVSSARIVVLNACYSDAHADALCRVVDCVVGMDGSISDDAARAFATSFYRALVHQRSVGNALAQVSATLAAKQVPGACIPRCRTRSGIDANRVLVADRGTREESWARRFAAILRLSQTAFDKLERDPLSAALRARQAIEHIVDYLHERELAATRRDQPLDLRFECVDAKLAISPLVASHIRSVLAHTRLAIEIAGVASDPAPGLLGPCLGSLAIAVEWFFHAYLKRPEMSLRWAPGAPVPARRPPMPGAPPLNSTATTGADDTTQIATDLGAFVPIWRTARGVSLIRIAPADGDALEQHAFRIEDPSATYFIGRTDHRSDGTPNDFVLPSSWTSVSRDQGHLASLDHGVVLTNTSKNSVFVRGERLDAGAARVLRHGDIVQFGRCVGMFTDGRYYAATPAAAIDRRTGLLSRLGLIAEIGASLATGDGRILLVIRCSDRATVALQSAPADPELLSASLALAIHRHTPSIPVARLGVHVAALLTSRDEIDAAVAVAHVVAGASCAVGFAALEGTAEDATPQLEACLGALNRVTIAGTRPVAPEDLARHALVLTPPDGFAARARSLFDLGGGAAIFALGDVPWLDREASQAVHVLERELLEVLGARMGPRDAVSLAGPGLVLFATSGDIERCAQEVSVSWHARGPLTVDRIEIDRWISTHLLAPSDLHDIARRAAAHVQRDSFAAYASGLPAPIALAAQAIDGAREVVDRARALLRLAELSWKLIAFALLAAGRGDGEPAIPLGDGAELATWPPPWRAVARSAGLRIEGTARRIAELAAIAVSPDHDVLPDSAIQLDPVVLAQDLPRLEGAARALLAAMMPLRGWTLVGVASSEVVDPDGTTQRIEYTDHTGPWSRGSHQRVMVTGLRPMGHFAYLVRWSEGLAIALEPFVRCAHDTAGDGELVLASATIDELGRSADEEVMDDAATG